MKISKAVLLIILLCVIRQSVGRGSSKKNSNGGNGNVLDNEYCLYVGNDCSSTCCIQQTCGATMADCEFGYDPNEYLLYYLIAAIVFSALLMPIVVKICLTVGALKVCKKKSKITNHVEYLTVSQFLGLYLCCFCRCCYHKPQAVSTEVTQDTKNNPFRFESDVMKDLEHQSFRLDEALDDDYLRVNESKQFLKPGNSTVMDIDNLFPNKSLEDESFDVHPYLGKYNTKGIKEIPLDGSEEDSVSVDKEMFMLKKETLTPHEDKGTISHHSSRSSERRLNTGSQKGKNKTKNSSKKDHPKITVQQINSLNHEVDKMESDRRLNKKSKQKFDSVEADLMNEIAPESSLAINKGRKKSKDLSSHRSDQKNADSTIELNEVEKEIEELGISGPNNQDPSHHDDIEKEWKELKGGH